MGTVMKASEFVKKLKSVATDYKTLYVMGCIGAPMTAANKRRYKSNHEYNTQATRIKHIDAASTDTFGFDCVCLIKAILWGWTGDKNKTYGGAKYASNGVPDINADTMIKRCTNVSTDFSRVEVGEALWTPGHIGVYIGDGLAVECTPAWKNKVQTTACNEAKAGYNTRKWKKHGKLPYIEYDVTDVPMKVPEPKPVAKPTASVKVKAARKRDNKLAGDYKVTASALHIRAGAGTDNHSLGTLAKNTVVHNYGYYDVASNGAKWLYVQTETGLTGFCSAAWLKKC